MPPARMRCRLASAATGRAGTMPARRSEVWTWVPFAAWKRVTRGLTAKTASTFSHSATSNAE